MEKDNYPFVLAPDEKILYDLTPVPAVKAYLTVGIALLLLVTFVGIVLIPFAPLLANQVYSQYHYWITDKRVVYKKGFLGYKVKSIPYARISDVIVSRSFFETLFGIASVNLQTLAGQISNDVGGAEASLLGVENPEEIAEVILEHVHRATNRI